MDVSKLILALVMLSSTAMAPAYAKTSDTPAFGIWLAQWAKNSHQTSNERMPCLRADKGACTKAFSSSVAGSHAASRKGAVSVVSRPARPNALARRHVIFKNGKRVETTALQSGETIEGMSAFGSSSLFMVVNDTGKNLLGINLDEPGVTLPDQVETLSDFVATVDQKTPPTDTLLADAAGGVGNSAFVSLYDFEDEGGSGEAQGGAQEISSLLGTQSLLASAAAIPEPGSLLLIGAALLALRVSRRGRLARGALLHLPT